MGDKVKMKRTITKIKIIASVAVVAFFFLLVFSITSISGNALFSITYWGMYFRSIGYQMEYGGIVASTTPEGGGNAQSVPVLLYHGISDQSDGTNIALKDFVDQMVTLKKAGWQTISYSDFTAFMKGEKTLPAKSFLLTFDGGEKDSYYPVDPLLKALKYSAVIFVITHYSLNNNGSNIYLTENELKQMIDSGRWEVEANAQNGSGYIPIDANGDQGYFFGNKEWLSNQNRLETTQEYTTRIEADLAGAKEDIQNGLGVQATGFAFPLNNFGPDFINFPQAESILANAVSSDYEFGFYEVWPSNGFTANYPDKNLSLIKRIDIEPYWTANDLLEILDESNGKTLPFSDDFSTYKGWLNAYGQLTSDQTSMTLSFNATTTGALAFLDGSYLWGNYDFESVVDLPKNQNFSLLARYQNNGTYVACNFTPQSIQIEQVVDGTENILIDSPTNGNFEGSENKLGILVNGDTIVCDVNGEKTIKVTAPSVPGNGGIGLKIWSSQSDYGGVTIKNVSVGEIQ